MKDGEAEFLRRAELVHRYVDAGGNLIDTADLYGASEEIYGRARGTR